MRIRGLILKNGFRICPRIDDLALTLTRKHPPAIDGWLSFCLWVLYAFRFSRVCLFISLSCFISKLLLLT